MLSNRLYSTEGECTEAVITGRIVSPVTFINRRSHLLSKCNSETKWTSWTSALRKKTGNRTVQGLSAFLPSVSHLKVCHSPMRSTKGPQPSLAGDRSTSDARRPTAPENCPSGSVWVSEGNKPSRPPWWGGRDAHDHRWTPQRGAGPGAQHWPRPFSRLPQQPSPHSATHALRSPVSSTRKDGPPDPLGDVPTEHPTPPRGASRRRAAPGCADRWVLTHWPAEWKRHHQLLSFTRQFQFSRITNGHQKLEGYPGTGADLNVKSIKTEPLQAAAVRTSTTRTSASLKRHSRHYIPR